MFERSSHFLLNFQRSSRSCEIFFLHSACVRAAPTEAQNIDLHRRARTSHGLIYDVMSGKLSEVPAASEAGKA